MRTAIHHRRRLLLLLFFFVLTSGEPPSSDSDGLWEFLSRTPHSPRIQWDRNAPACSWTGVSCDESNSSILALRLPGTGLIGQLDFPGISSIRVLSLHHNGLSGPIPDLSNLTSLRSLYLHYNDFSGPFPNWVSTLPFFFRLDLSFNKLNGTIPASLNNLRILNLLRLQGNRLSGRLPSLDTAALKFFNVSSNMLNGSIPASLSKFPISAFAGNGGLCGKPLDPCTPFFPPSPGPTPEKPDDDGGDGKKLSKGAIVGIALAAAVGLLLLILLCCWLVVWRKRGRRDDEKPVPRATPTPDEGGVKDSATSAMEAATSSTSKEEMGERNKLVFVGSNGGYTFDLEDLLRASAEVLGKGAMGTSYKAVLEDSTTVVVKRLKDVAVERKAFESQMEVLGGVKPHDNVVPLRAFYFSKDEKLLVYDYLADGSLSSLLHGNRASGRSPLDWEGRLHVALAVGHGLNHLHASAELPHGNLKASNVLLRPNLDASALSDYGLNSLFAPTSSAPNGRAVGYRAPEFVETRKPTFKSDVYSFGVLLLELLTGKAPNQSTSIGDEGIDLPRWVQSVVKEEWTGEVFDVDLLRLGGEQVEEELVQLLQVAMSCVAVAPDTRPDMVDVVRLMEEIAKRSEEVRRMLSDDQAKGQSPQPS